MYVCMYCKEMTINYEMFVVRKATKPKHAPNRWVRIGLCCEVCEAKGNPVNIPYVPNKPIV